MATTIKPRRTSTAGRVPTTADLQDGEFAVNTTDRRLFIRVGSTIVDFTEFKAAFTGTVPRTLLDKLFDIPVHLFDFVPASEQAKILNGTSTYDCADAIDAAIAAATAADSRSNIIKLPRGLINVSRGFTITRPVMFEGEGNKGFAFNQFPMERGTIIKYTGAAATGSLRVFRFNHINYGGSGMKRLTVDGGGLVFRCVELDAVIGFEGDTLTMTGASNALLALVSTSDTTSWNQFKNISLADESNGGCCLYLGGGDGPSSVGSNACHCTFENLNINHGGNRHGIILGGCDNITFLMTYIFRAAGGTGNGVKVAHALLDGGVNWFPVANTFYHLQAGLGGWNEPAGGNTTYPTAVIYGYQTDNGQPLPVTNGRRLPYWSNSGGMIGVEGVGRTSYGADWGFSVNGASGSNAIDVNFPGGPRSSNAYTVVLNVPTTIAYAILNKTAAGFRIQFAANLTSNISVDVTVLGG